MARAQTRELSRPRDITARASPVDSYVRPANPPRSNLHDLAHGLAAFSDGLSGLLDKRQAEADKDAALAAERDFNLNNGLAWGEAVRTGKVPPQHSPVYQESYKLKQGQAMGLRIQSEFNQAYLG